MFQFQLAKFIFEIREFHLIVSLLNWIPYEMLNAILIKWYMLLQVADVVQCHHFSPFMQVYGPSLARFSDIGGSIGHSPADVSRGN